MITITVSMPTSIVPLKETCILGKWKKSIIWNIKSYKEEYDSLKISEMKFTFGMSKLILYPLLQSYIFGKRFGVPCPTEK